MKNYGFVFKPSEEGEWHVGQGVASQRFGAVDYMPNGHGWGKYTPTGERQNNGFESMACTIYGSLNALETLANFKGFKDFPKNCSERFDAILAKITPTGADPHTSCESIRKWGVIPQEVLPFTDDIQTWPDYYYPDPMEEAFIKLGQDILRKYVIGHEYVFNGATGATPKADRLISALSRGTVCVSVHAWKERNGRYYKDPADDDNHWVHLVDYKMGDYWLVRDTYAPFDKKIAWDTNFQSAKLFFLSENTSGITPNWLDWAFSALKNALAKLTIVKKKMTDEPKPSIQEKYPEPLVSPKLSNREMLYYVAKSHLGIDLTPDDKIDDFVACVAQLQQVFHLAFGKYIGSGPTLYSTKYLVDFLRKSPDFEIIPWNDALFGDICVFGTGENVRDSAPNIRGHCWVVGKNQWMSNNSNAPEKGLWTAHSTKQQIEDYYGKFAGFPLDKSVFRIK